MTPQINISQSLMDKLKSIAEPFEDTPESVISRCVDSYLDEMATAGPQKNVTVATPSHAGVMPYPADAPPSLTFTRPISISLDGQAVDKQELYWNLFLFKVVAKAASKLSHDKLRQALLVNYVEGENTVSGYRFIKEAKLSVQGADANAAWKATMYLIQATGMNVDVTFRWDSKEGAAHPGQVGRMIHKAV